MTNLQTNAEHCKKTYKRVLDLFDDVGLNRGMCLPPGVFSADFGGIQCTGGVDILKAGRIPCFKEKITDQNGGINRAIAQAGMLPGRRALLAHVVSVLVSEHGAEVVRHYQDHSRECDEGYTLKLDGLRVRIELARE